VKRTIFYFGVRRDAKSLTVFLERWKRPRRRNHRERRIPEASRLELRLTGDEKRFAFAYATQRGEWQTLAAE